MANIFKYTDATGPAWVDGTTTFTATFGFQSLAANRTYTFPDAAGTIALTSNITGTNSGTNTGDVTLSAFGSSPSATGGALTGQALALQPADATHPGGVSTTTQSFAGNKTFTGTVAITGKVLSTAGLGVGNSVAGTTLGTVTKSIEVFDAAGASLGFVAVYDAIT